MTEEIKYTLKQLQEKLTEKERIFCHEYIIDWNGSRAARAAKYSEKTCAAIASENLTKPYIKKYLDFIKDDFEKEAGISKLKQLKELHKIAYSSIAHLHNTWIELSDFEKLTEYQKASIESIDTKIEQKACRVDLTLSKKDGIEVKDATREVKYVKIKLYSKTQALEMINKMLGYNSPDKLDLTSKGESLNNTEREARIKELKEKLGIKEDE